MHLNIYKRKKVLFIILAVLLLLFSFGSGCTPTKAQQYKENGKSEQKDTTTNNDTYSKPKVDTRWPTTEPELLSIPESQRWYTASSRIGTYGTIAGPVKNIYYASNSKGHPTFIDIGTGYSGEAQIVIWESEYFDCQSLIDDAYNLDAWVSVTGQITSYNGKPQITSNGYISWRTWWNVS